MKPAILLVEDNTELMDIIAEDLQDEYQVFRSRNGKQGLQILQQHAVHLVISDVMMPVMDGFELCSAIKSSSEYGHIPVILLTAKNSLAAKIEGLGLGADTYIDKPFDMEYLLASIGSLLNNRKKIKDHFDHIPAGLTGPIPPEKIFAENLTKVILENMDDFDLDVDKLAKLMDTSRTSLFRKIKAITDLTPNELINVTRLQKAAALLTEGKYKIYEVSDMVGYGSQTNFGRNFYKHFGMTPTAFQKEGNSK